MTWNERIDTLAKIVTPQDGCLDGVWNLLHRFETLVDRSNDVLVKRLVQIVVVVAVSYGVTAGFISEGPFGGFQVKKVSVVLGFTPLLVAMLWYDALLAAAHIALLEDPIKACYRVILPRVEKADIHRLACPPNFIGIEDMLPVVRGSRYLGPFLARTSRFMFAFYFVAPLLALGLSSYQVAARLGLSWLAATPLVIAAWLIALRGVVVLAYTLTADHAFPTES